MLLVAAAWAIRLSLDPYLGQEHHPYATFYLAIAIAEWRLGLGPALMSMGLGLFTLMSMGLGLFSSWWWIMPPRSSLRVQGTADIVEIVLYVVVTGTIVFLIHRLQAARQQAAESARIARKRQEQLEADIAAREKAERALRETEQRFRSLADNLQDVIWISSPDLRRVLYVNPSYERIWGRPAQAIYDDSSNWIVGIHPEDRPRIEELWRSGRLGSQFELEYRIQRSDGSIRWVRDRGFPVETAPGKVICVAGIAEDITVRKEIEEARARNREELERLVEERTAKLRQTVAELEHFSYALTHDMRAPLRAMHGYAEFLQQLCPPSEPQAHEFCRHIIAAAERLDLLICDSLNYTKVMRQNLPMHPVALSPLVHGLIDTYPNLLPYKENIRIEDPLPVVMGNEAGLTQCFSNLLGNAVKFVPPGKRPQIRLHAEPHDDMVRVDVEDNGIGIPPESRHHLFQMFSRLNTRYEGTGVGLAIVRKVVERMGGTVGVEPRNGEGSRFWIELHLAKRLAA